MMSKSWSNLPIQVSMQKQAFADYSPLSQLERCCISVSLARWSIRFLILLIHRHLIDESISICVVLQTPYFNELQLKSYISRLAINVEAHAFSYSSPSKEQESSKDQSPSQSRDIIWSSTVNTAEEPLIIVQQKDSQDESPLVYIVWKVLAYLSR